MKFLGFLVILGGTYAIAFAAGASAGWATAIAWVVAIAVGLLVRRIALYRADTRAIMQTPEYKENARRADEFFRRSSPN